MRIGVDAMGGDQAPGVEVKGCLAARALLHKDDRIVLVGREDEVRQHLQGVDGWEEFIEIRHAGQVIGMDESPVEALRAKPDSSLAQLAQMHADGEVDACVSAGNTGACVASAQMRLRRLPGAHRPGIAIVAPAYHGPVVICDVGANVNCRPQHLHQYGLMASVYARSVCGVEEPRVGLLSIGEEAGKGNSLVKQTRELIENDPALRSIGNIEGRDLFGGVCDVVVCDGFTGNVVLKLMEGMAAAVVHTMLEELLTTMADQRELINAAGRGIAAKYDFNEYGGAPLLGVGGIYIICHGASNSHGMMNAIRVAAESSRHRVNEQITELLSQPQRTANE